MDSTAVSTHLWIELAVSGGFVLLMVVVHALGLLGIARLLGLNAKKLKRRKVDPAGLLLIAGTGLLLFVLHIFEIVIFAIFYLKMEASIHTMGDALFYSASAYVTLGLPNPQLPHNWLLVAAIEGLIGFVVIGWSTAFVARMMAKLRA